VNRRLAAGKLAIDFKNPWNYLAEMPAEARGEAPSEARQSVGILFKMSSDFFQQTPPLRPPMADFAVHAQLIQIHAIL